MRASNETIHVQASFVSRLSNRLCQDALAYDSHNIYAYHTRIQADIKRLRRELLDLSKMFDLDWSRTHEQ